MPEQPTITKACPQCGALLVVRWNRTTHKPFLGCQRWPDCSHTELMPLDLQLRAQSAPELPLWEEGEQP